MKITQNKSALTIDPCYPIEYNTHMKDRNGSEPNGDLIKLARDYMDSWGEPYLLSALIGALLWHDSEFLEEVCRDFMERHHPEDLKVFDKNREICLDPTTSS